MTERVKSIQKIYQVDLEGIMNTKSQIQTAYEYESCTSHRIPALGLK